jgi:hypothetical protein
MRDRGRIKNVFDFAVVYISVSNAVLAGYMRGLTGMSAG